MTVRLVIILLTISTFVGCSNIKKSAIFAQRDKAYLTAKSIPPLRIPPGLSSNKFNNYYPIPERNYPEVQTVSVVPPGLY